MACSLVATTVTVLSPDHGVDAGMYEEGRCGPREAEEEEGERKKVEEAVSVRQRECEPPRRAVEALFVFGGMDTQGTIHNDCFVFVPDTHAQ